MLQVGDNTHHFGLGAAAGQDAAPDGRLAAEQQARESLVEDDHVRTVGRIERSQGSSLPEAQAHRVEVAGRHDALVGPRVVAQLARLRAVGPAHYRVLREQQRTRFQPAVGQPHGRHARESLDAPDQRIVEAPVDRPAVDDLAPGRSAVAARIAQIARVADPGGQDVRAVEAGIEDDEPDEAAKQHRCAYEQRNGDRYLRRHQHRPCAPAPHLDTARCLPAFVEVGQEVGSRPSQRRRRAGQQAEHDGQTDREGHHRTVDFDLVEGGHVSGHHG
ncbi:MAG: hypothetical protein OXH75_28635, partial [Acidobacteria bacterium]|nr:hypothetical protein [Acidobacteriota bacterium]